MANRWPSTQVEVPRFQELKVPKNVRDELNFSAVQHDASQMTRRQFGGLMLGAGAMLATGGALGMSGAHAATAAAAPKRGGTIKIALTNQGTSDTFDGGKILQPGDYIRCASIYSYLTRLNGQGQAMPELAESFERNATATVWTFKIRKGVSFHDGAPLTMDDVIFSIMRHKEERVASNARQLSSNIQSVKADGPNTIVVTLATPDVDLPLLIGTYQFTIVKNGTYDFSKPVGTGAFKVKEFSPGVRTICVRNDNYWKAGQPYLDGFEMFGIADQVARANALLSGDIDVMLDLRGPNIEQVAKSSNAVPFVTKAPRYTSIQATTDIAPGTIPDLGLAMSYLIDRERMLKTVLRGNGVIANDQPIMPGSPLYDTGLAQRALDHDKAKFHIKKAGVGNARIPVHVSEVSAFSVEIGQLLQREASLVGLNIDLHREPSDNYWSAICGKKAFFAVSFNPRPTYNMLLNLAWKTGAAWNFSHFSDPKLDAMIDQARASTDDKQRLQLYADIQTTIHNSGAIVQPCFINFVDGVSKRVQGLTPVPVAPLGGCLFTDSVWLSA
jgi:peptide/nickel transport system substrate-binding protein